MITKRTEAFYVTQYGELVKAGYTRREAAEIVDVLSGNDTLEPDDDPATDDKVTRPLKARRHRDHTAP